MASPLEFFQLLLDTEGFPARWHCGLWTEGHGWLHIGSDIAIFLAYFAIPTLLLYFARRRKNVVFPKVLWLFCAFIWACGLTHLVDATLFWHPWYRLSGLLKFITAMVSWATVIALIPALPKALKLPNLQQLNEKLKTEIEERQRAEALLTAVFESSPMALLVLSAEGDIEMANEQAESLFGYSKDELRASNIGLILPVRTTDNTALPLQTPTQGEAINDLGSGEVDRLAKHREGHTFPIEMGVHSLDGPEGGKRVCAIVDGTRRKVHEEEMESVMTRLERSNSELQTFSYAVAHDLRAPLRGIRQVAGFLILDEELNLNEEVKRRLGQIHERTTRMEHLIAGILDYSTINRINKAREEVSISECIENAYALVGTDQDLSLEFPPDLPSVFGYPLRLQRLFQNLFSNAIKYTTRSPKVVKVGWSENEDFWEISIEDNGIGIEESYHEKIFEVFKRLSSDYDPTSAGIGLALVKKIVDDHKGKVWVDSTVGVGTTIHVTIAKEHLY